MLEGAALEGAAAEGAVLAEELLVEAVSEAHPDNSTAAPIINAADPAKVLLCCSFMVALPMQGVSKARFFPWQGATGSGLGRAS